MMRNKFPIGTVPLEVLAQLSVDNVAGESSSFVKKHITVEWNVNHSFKDFYCIL